MKYLQWLLIFITMYTCPAVMAGEEADAYYRRSNDRAWRYGLILLANEKITDQDKEKIERDLASSAFTYWYLRSKQLTEKNLILEANIRNFFSELKGIRGKVFDDPLGLYSNDVRGLGLKGIMIKDREYPELIKKFQEYVSTLK